MPDLRKFVRRRTDHLALSGYHCSRILAMNDARCARGNPGRAAPAAVHRAQGVASRRPAIRCLQAGAPQPRRAALTPSAWPGRTDCSRRADGATSRMRACDGPSRRQGRDVVAGHGIVEIGRPAGSPELAPQAAAAVHRHDLAVHEAGSRAGEEDRRLGDLAQRPRAAQRVGAVELATRLGRVDLEPLTTWLPAPACGAARRWW